MTFIFDITITTYPILFLFIKWVCVQKIASTRWFFKPLAKWPQFDLFYHKMYLMSLETFFSHNNMYMNVLDLSKSVSFVLEDIDIGGQIQYLTCTGPLGHDL